jgi:hypothetical protein
MNIPYKIPTFYEVEHTVKKLLMINTVGLMLDKTSYEGGRKHDYDDHPITPQAENIVDLDYLGI